MDGRVQKVFLFSGEGQPRKGEKAEEKRKKKLDLNQDRLITGSYVTRSDVWSRLRCRMRRSCRQQQQIGLMDTEYDHHRAPDLTGEKKQTRSPGERSTVVVGCWPSREKKDAS